jgi:hypothetical protein
MKREKVVVKVEDFKRIAQENEYFLWHFLMEDQNESPYAMWSIFDNKYINLFDKKYINSIDDIIPNPLNMLLSEINVPYFESYTKDSMDFLINLGIDSKILFQHPKNLVYHPRKMSYHPIIIGFKRTSEIWNTHKSCYCVEGITETLLRMNPELLSNIE